jgi:hypothetical protein
MLIAQDRRINDRSCREWAWNSNARSEMAAPTEMQSSWLAATLARSSFQSGAIRILLNEAQ